LRTAVVPIYRPIKNNPPNWAFTDEQLAKKESFIPELRPRAPKIGVNLWALQFDFLTAPDLCQPCASPEFGPRRFFLSKVDRLNVDQLIFWGVLNITFV
jgi:hypothetical protein